MIFYITRNSLLDFISLDTICPEKIILIDIEVI